MLIISWPKKSNVIDYLQRFFHVTQQYEFACPRTITVSCAAEPIHGPWNTSSVAIAVSIASSIKKGFIFSFFYIVSLRIVDKRISRQQVYNYLQIAVFSVSILLKVMVYEIENSVYSINFLFLLRYSTFLHAECSRFCEQNQFFFYMIWCVATETFSDIQRRSFLWKLGRVRLLIFLITTKSWLTKVGDSTCNISFNAIYVRPTISWSLLLFHA